MLCNGYTLLECETSRYLSNCLSTVASKHRLLEYHIVDQCHLVFVFMYRFTEETVNSFFSVSPSSCQMFNRKYMYVYKLESFTGFIYTIMRTFHRNICYQLR